MDQPNGTMEDGVLDKKKLTFLQCKECHNGELLVTLWQSDVFIKKIGFQCLQCSGKWETKDFTIDMSIDLETDQIQIKSLYNNAKKVIL